MTEAKFLEHMGRLKRMWPNAYPNERATLLFNAVKAMPDFWMEQTTNYFISNSRMAPLLEQFQEKIVSYEERKKEEALQDKQLSGFGSVTGSNFLSQMETAALTTENKEFAKRCTQLLRDKLEGKITEEQFRQGCDFLDQAARSGNACAQCGSTGYCTADDVRGNRYIYRCSCQTGRHRPIHSNGPRRQDGTWEEHEIYSIEQAGR